MKRSVTNNLFVLAIIVANFCFLNSSCAQPPQPPSYCEIFAYETQIDSIEALTNNLAKRMNLPEIMSVWKKFDYILRPTEDRKIMAARNESKSVKPVAEFAAKKKELIQVRDAALRNYLNLLIQKCGDSEDSYYEPQYDTRHPKPSKEGGREPVVEEAEEDVFDPKEFTSQQLPIEKELPFVVMDDIEYGRKSDLKKYICILYDPKSTDYHIDFLYSAPTDKTNTNYVRLGSFKRTINYMKNNNKSPEMLMNAGIFNPDFKPAGLFCRNGKKAFEFNNKRGLPGNFYMEPGGVFAIKKDGSATILTKDKISKNLKAIDEFQYATQSGPMLVFDGDINLDFKSRSPNLHIRNGVGILPDGKILFVMSKDEVNLFEFALLFKDGFKCKEALYLDGNISKIYAPSINRLEQGGDFSGIIAIYKKSSK